MRRAEPLHVFDKILASRLIGKKVLFANDREGLGFYGVLLGINQDKFVVKGIKGHTYKCNWIVEDTF